MLHKILYTIGFLVSLSCIGQDGTCNNKKEVFDLNTLSKCSIIVKKNKPTRVISTRTKVRPRTRTRSIKKVNNISLGKTNGLAAIRKVTELASKIEMTNKTLETLPLSLVEVKPVFSDCELENSENQAKCFTDQMNKHISENLRYPSNSYKKGIQGRVFVQFLIDEYGVIGEIKASGPFNGEELNREAVRIIKELPKFNSPGRMGGNTVRVRHSMPIYFKIEGVKATNIRSENKVHENLLDVKSIVNVETLPLFKNCEYVAKAAQPKCFIAGMINHINDNIEYPESAAADNIEGRIYVQFVIDKEGYVVNVVTKGAKGTEELKEEAKRIISKLPKLIPAKINGKAVNVKHTLPITFKL